MTIDIIKNDKTLTIALKGRLDTSTAPNLENVINEQTDGITNLLFDMSGLEYISSAGLRVLLATNKKMIKVGSMKLSGVCETVMDVFEMTGFSDYLVVHYAII